MPAAANPIKSPLWLTTVHRRLHLEVHPFMPLFPHRELATHRIYGASLAAAMSERTGGRVVEGARLERV